MASGASPGTCKEKGGAVQHQTHPQPTELELSVAGSSAMPSSAWGRRPWPRRRLVLRLQDTCRISKKIHVLVRDPEALP